MQANPSRTNMRTMRSSRASQRPSNKYQRLKAAANLRRHEEEQPHLDQSAIYSLLQSDETWAANGVVSKRNAKTIADSIGVNRPGYLYHRDDQNTIRVTQPPVLKMSKEIAEAYFQRVSNAQSVIEIVAELDLSTSDRVAESPLEFAIRHTVLPERGSHYSYELVVGSSNAPAATTSIVKRAFAIGARRSLTAGANINMVFIADNLDESRDLNTYELLIKCVADACTRFWELGCKFMAREMIDKTLRILDESQLDAAFKTIYDRVVSGEGVSDAGIREALDFMASNCS